MIEENPIEEWIAEVTAHALPEVQAFIRQINEERIVHGDRLDTSEEKTKAIIDRAIRAVLEKEPIFRANIIAKDTTTEPKFMSSAIVLLVKASFEKVAASMIKNPS